jgi:hypothetical protein
VALAAMIREKLPTICLSLNVIAIPFLNTMQSIIAQEIAQIKRLEIARKTVLLEKILSPGLRAKDEIDGSQQAQGGP